MDAIGPAPCLPGVPEATAAGMGGVEVQEQRCQGSRRLGVYLAREQGHEFPAVQSRRIKEQLLS